MEDEKTLVDVMEAWALVSMRNAMQEARQIGRENGLSMAQIAVLMRLQHHTNCTVTEIGQHLDVTNAAASQLVQKMVEQDLLSRTEHPEDRRVKQINLTGDGLALMQKISEARGQWMLHVVARLSPDEREHVGDAFNALIRAASKASQTEIRQQSSELMHLEERI